MLRIRLARIGRRNDPHYRIVVAEHSKSPKGKYVALVGSFSPKSKRLNLKPEEIIKWLNFGAQPSERVARILAEQKIDHKLIVVKKYRAISKKELEKQKTIDEAEKAKEHAEKEKQAAEALEKLKELEEKKHEEMAEAQAASTDEVETTEKSGETEKPAGDKPKAGDQKPDTDQPKAGGPGDQEPKNEA